MLQVLLWCFQKGRFQIFQKHISLNSQPLFGSLPRWKPGHEPKSGWEFRLKTHVLPCREAPILWVHSFGTDSRMRIHGREARCVLLSDIPIPEWTEYYSGHSVPEGGMNRIILKTVYSEERSKSKKCSFRKTLFWLFSLPLISSQTNSSHERNRFGLLILLLDNIPSNLLFSFRVFSFWNSPKRMPP